MRLSVVRASANVDPIALAPWVPTSPEWPLRPNLGSVFRERCRGSCKRGGFGQCRSSAVVASAPTLSGPLYRALVARSRAELSVQPDIRGSVTCSPLACSGLEVACRLVRRLLPEGRRPVYPSVFLTQRVAQSTPGEWQQRGAEVYSLSACSLPSGEGRSTRSGRHGSR